ncbi:MAG: FAD-linked oxidase C-terminal domain-containing protein [Brevibacterium yomogidense]|uniref:FAD-linked oxidase C-terminal domain-containing protein n=1 Tax=Brevibacterium sp. Mu109 TaxID=1255669 RepID=UPI000C7905F2|nr:FAD-linked oxidase C-terminal domain-containing protein [Brevibacterium sp. Mu109]
MTSTAPSAASGGRTAATLDELVAQLPDGAVITDPVKTEAYRRDRAEDPNAGTPAAVVRATSTEDVQAVVRYAAATGTPVVPRGAGTSLSGGSTAIDGGIVLSLERMRDITIDPVTRTAVTQPGAFNVEVKEAAGEHDLWYPPDPASFTFCSIGGNIATNAGGLCCVKYGVTTDYVLGMKVVLADGRAIELGGPRLKDVAGLSLTKLFVGSEGTLGIITEVTLRLVPAQRPPHTLVATFPTLDSATAAVLAITQRMRPSMLEFMDRPTINAVEDETKMGLDRDAAAMIIVQSDEPAGHAGVEIAEVTQLCESNGATEVFSTDDADEGEAFIAARRIAIPAVEKKGTILLEDVGVPLPRLGALVSGIDEISQRHDVLVAVMAHAGDGNTHPLVVFDPTDAEQRERAHTAYGEIMDLAVSLGGTITGEHGVGRLKQPWLAGYLGEDVLDINQRVKDALDPQGILNPGVVFDARPESDPVTAEAPAGAAAAAAAPAGAAAASAAVQTDAPAPMTSTTGEPVSFSTPTITYDLAARAVALTIEEGKKAGVRTCATIVDPALQLVAYGRTDGMTPHSVETSRRKAQTAASTRRPSALILPELAQKLEHGTGGLLTSIAGGVPIAFDGVVVGGLGVAGGKPPEDAAIADAVLAALGADPAETAS